MLSISRMRVPLYASYPIRKEVDEQTIVGCQRW